MVSSSLSHRSFSLIPCENPLWAPEGHSQTILADFLPSRLLTEKGQKWVMQFPDQDKLICRVFDQGSPWVIALFHGLTGSSDAPYIQRVAREFLKLGQSCVLMNHRNCGEGKGLASQPYHSGKSDDVGFVIEQIRQRFPGKKVLAIGFSMSANALLLLMSRVVPNAQIFEPALFEARKKALHLSLPDAALTVNAPINLAKTSQVISRNLNRIYEYGFMRSLHGLIKDLEAKGVLAPAYGLSPLMKVSYFDDKFTAPRSGFKSGQHYYETCGSAQYVSQIDRPTACLMSQNDPFIDYKDYLNAKFSKSVRLHVESNGGHMGYLHKTKTPIGTNRWLDYGILEVSKQLMLSN